jgi:hypothetical protein
MNAYVEVATAEVVVQTQTVLVLVTRAFGFVKAIALVVVASTKRVLSIAGTSISAVSPDYTLIGGTA